MNTGTRAVRDVLAERERLRAAFGMSESWPLHDVLAKLIEATQHLLDQHGCDAHGYEEFRHAANVGKDYLGRISDALSGAGPPVETDDARDAVRYRWLKAEDRKRMPLATISWRQRSSNLPCKLADSDPLDALIDAAIASPDASVEQIYNSAVKADERPAPLAHGLRHCPTCGEELGEDGHHKSDPVNGGI